MNNIKGLTTDRNEFQNFLSNTYDNESKSYKYELLDQSSSERRIACVKKIVLE